MFTFFLYARVSGLGQFRGRTYIHTYIHTYIQVIMNAIVPNFVFCSIYFGPQVVSTGNPWTVRIYFIPTWTLWVSEEWTPMVVTVVFLITVLLAHPSFPVSH